MAHMSLGRRVELPARKVWEGVTSLLSPDNPDRDKILARLDFDIRIEGRGVGQMIYTELRNPTLLGVIGHIVERLEEWDPERRFMRYRIIDNGPLPVTDVLLSFKVTAHGASASSYRYEAEFTPVSATEEEIRTLFTRNWILIKHILNGLGGASGVR